MNPRLPALLLMALSGGMPAAALADAGLLSLANNPFTRPEILKPKPPPRPEPRVELPPEEVELNVSATLVSKTAPMAVVDGELLALGDRIDGFKLISVMEGKAVFSRGGRRYTFVIESREQQRGRYDRQP